jgi:hypothetical protein
MLRMRLSLYCGYVAVATQVGPDNRFAVITAPLKAGVIADFEIRLNMDALHPLLENVRRLGLKLEQDSMCSIISMRLWSPASLV